MTTTIHNSTTCDCEMCRFADEQERREQQAIRNLAADIARARLVSRVVDAVNAEVIANHGLLPDDFHAAWDAAPRSMRNYVEWDVAQWWFLRGRQVGLSEGLMTHGADTREVLRVARERIIR
jgi:hypothetical protein